MGLISRLYDFVNITQTADADQIDAEYNNIHDLVNGQLDNANVKNTAGIYGSKLADAPNGVPTVKINNDAVDSTKLQDHVSDNLQRAVKSDHIVDGAVITIKIGDLQVTTGKLDNLAVTGAKVAAATIGTDKLKLTIHNRVITTYNPAGLGTIYGIMSVEGDDSGTNWGGKVQLAGDGFGVFATEYITPQTLTDPSGSTFAKGTYDLVGLFAKNVTIGASTITFTLVYVFLTKVS